MSSSAGQFPDVWPVSDSLFSLFLPFQSTGVSLHLHEARHLVVNVILCCFMSLDPYFLFFLLPSSPWCRCWLHRYLPEARHIGVNAVFKYSVS